MAAAHRSVVKPEGARFLWCSGALLVALLVTSAAIAVEQGGSLTVLVGSKAAQLQTYFEWNTGSALSNIQQFLGDLKDPVTILDWQKVYRQQASLNTVLGKGRGRGECDGANGTLRFAAQGSLNGFAYRADTNATATMNKPLPPRKQGETSMVGTGMLPIVCAQTRAEAAGGGVGAMGGIECNVLFAQAMVKVGLPPANPADNTSYSSAQLLDCGSQCQSFNDSFQFQSAATGIHLPLSYTQLYVEQAAQFSSLPLDTETFIGEQNNPLSLDNLQTAATLNAYVPLSNTPVCANTTSVVPSLSSYILGGTTAFCARWNGVLVAMTWKGVLPEYNLMQEEDCAQLVGEQYFGLVMYPQDFDTTGDEPFQSIYVFQRDAPGGAAQLSCVYSMKQSVSPESNNWNWAQLYSLGETRRYITGNGDHVCGANGSYTTTSAGAAQNVYGMSYTVEYLPPESVATKNDNVQLRGLAFLHFSSQSMSQLDGWVNVANSTKIMADAKSGDTCVLKEREPSKVSTGAGSVNLANGLLRSLLALAMQSAYASNQGSTLAAARAQIVALLGRFTLISALNNALTSIAAGYGVNAFKTRLPCLLDKTWAIIAVRVGVSLVEAISVNVAAIAYLWGLVAHRFERATASWVHTTLNQSFDYEDFTLVASTVVTLTGQVQHFAIQIAVILVAILISSGLVMYRWHFATPANDRNGVFTGLKNDL
eukprot:TRINITY_DN16643_c0_g1_i1.p1 TRINITY_DN16643_c0_g1~~TRINITY_DN16643_c0_g1_i1.p1  ORF type:complete len:708 (-),score=77.89 TRINITY_DN16643_c0_g1_i1:312-2435(-)